MPFCYILYSKSLGSYYVGSTSLTVEERLKRHLQMHKGYTAKAKYWMVVFSQYFETNEEARKRECEIKSWKSKRMIERLIGSSTE
ncbi:MAG: GIY-YIG nuclease family protein [Chitinophagaceae bacterium]|nr:GIY-YIG nuclease family protein [Chitinophagaceae bacterium]